MTRSTVPAAAVLAAVLLSACAARNETSLSVDLVYPQEGPSAEVRLPAASRAAAPPGAPLPAAEGIPRAAYPKAPSNRILIRVLAPHIPIPVEAWFDRSAGRGVVGGIPPGDRIAVEVDEYDNTALTLGTDAPLLGRGRAFGVSLAAGQTRTVTVPMYSRGTILRVCGAPPSGGAGTPGDGGDGGLADNAFLGEPRAVKIGPGDNLFVSCAAYNRIRRIDRYGYIDHYAGNGSIGSLANGDNAATAPIGPVYDIDIGVTGNMYLITWDHQIIRIDPQSGQLTVKYDAQKGDFNTSRKPNFAVADDNTFYFANGFDNRVFKVQGGIRSDYVADVPPLESFEGADKDHYPLLYPSSVCYSVAGPYVIFADRDNSRIKFVVMGMGDTGTVYTKVGGGGAPFIDNVDPLSEYLAYPIYFESDTLSGTSYYRERNIHSIRIINKQYRVVNLAGTGAAGYSGDGDSATLAQFYDPQSVAVDSRGNVYIADTGNHAIRMVVGGALP